MCLWIFRLSQFFDLFRITLVCLKIMGHTQTYDGWSSISTYFPYKNCNFACVKRSSRHTRNPFPQDANDPNNPLLRALAVGGSAPKRNHGLAGNFHIPLEPFRGENHGFFIYLGDLLTKVITETMVEWSKVWNMALADGQFSCVPWSSKVESWIWFTQMGGWLSISSNIFTQKKRIPNIAGMIIDQNMKIHHNSTFWPFLSSKPCW